MLAAVETRHSKPLFRVWEDVGLLHFFGTGHKKL
jgi:hypothetical protein